MKNKEMDSFESLNKVDIYAYLNWYLSIKDSRITEVYKKIFGSEIVVFSESRLIDLANYLIKNIHLEKISESDLKKKKDKLDKWVSDIHRAPQYKFIEPTKSLIFDLGLYFGELIQHEVVGLEWDTVTSKKNIMYGHPVLVKKGISEKLSPQWIINIIAFQLLEGEKEKFITELLSGYKKWKNTFQNKQIDYLALVNSFSSKQK